MNPAIAKIKPLLFMQLLVALALTACTTNTPITSIEAHHPVNHVVLVWLKDDTNKSAIIDKIIQDSYKLTEIKALKTINGGRSIPSERKIVDDSFDVGLTMQFNNLADMQSYLTDPKHVAFVKSIKPMIKKLVVYDFK